MKKRFKGLLLSAAAAFAVGACAYFTSPCVHAVLPKNMREIMDYAKSLSIHLEPAKQMAMITKKFSGCEYYYPFVTRICLIANLLDEQQVNSLFNDQWKDFRDGHLREPLDGCLSPEEVPYALTYWINHNIEHDPKNLKSLYIYSILTEKPVDTISQMFKLEKGRASEEYNFSLILMKLLRLS